MAVFQLEKNEIYFPKPELGEEDGLLAIGGDLSVDRLLLAYSNGIFPWYNADTPIMWWCPMERFIIKPNDIHISKSLKKYMKNHDSYILFNRDFSDTMHRCRMKRENEEGGTWIHDDMEVAYRRLYDPNSRLVAIKLLACSCSTKSRICSCSGVISTPSS